uniref:Basement membrane-specific heparan sulfate proteoglycan core protein-like n=1 Tax=Dermatophagoides pteronyssinus TaxID=6956 RepID=A0A6P6YGL1_DERPT
MLFQKFVVILCVIFISFAAAKPPKLNKFLPQSIQDHGTKFALFCLVQDGQKPFIFEWRFNDQLLKPSSDQSDYRIDSFNDDQSQLTIAKLDPKHSGTYSCIARNDFGFDKQSTHLIVT